MKTIIFEKDNDMASEAKKYENKRNPEKKKSEKAIPSVSLPNREEPNLVPSTYTLEKKNKEKLARLAKANGYEKSTAAFLNDLIAGIKE